LIFLEKNYTVESLNEDAALKGLEIKKNKSRGALPTNEIDLENLKNNISPSTNHADDASILHNSLLICKKFNINCSVIHDSIGSHPATAALVKLIFKQANFKYIENLLEETPFPMNILEKEFTNVKKIKKNNNQDLQGLQDL